MSDLVEFLRACLDEDERIAQAAGEAPWSASVPGMIHVDASAIRDNKGAYGKLGYVASAQHDEYRVHIGRWDPARVLAEVEAKRQIVDWCAEVIGQRDLSTYGNLGCLRDDSEALAVTLAMETLRLLTQPYADHPDYDASWAAGAGLGSSGAPSQQ